MPSSFFPWKDLTMAHAEVGVPKRRHSKMTSLKRTSRMHAGGIQIDPVFCPSEVADPFDTLEWDRRTATSYGASFNRSGMKASGSRQPPVGRGPCCAWMSN